MSEQRATPQDGQVSVALQFERPDWEPLLNVLDEEVVEQFMWMHEVELEDGTRVHAYKHWLNRRYLYLGRRGDAYLHIEPEDLESDEPDRYVPQRLCEALELALGPPRWPEAERMRELLEKREAEEDATTDNV